MFISFSFSCSFHVQFNVHFYFIHLLHFISLHFTSFHVIQSQKNLACLCLQTNQRRLWLATGSNVEIGTNTAMEFATAKNSASEQLQILWKSVEVSVKLEFVNLFGGRGGVLLNPISILYIHGGTTINSRDLQHSYLNMKLELSIQQTPSGHSSSIRESWSIALHVAVVIWLYLWRLSVDFLADPYGVNQGPL